MKFGRGQHSLLMHPISDPLGHDSISVLPCAAFNNPYQKKIGWEANSRVDTKVVQT